MRPIRSLKLKGFDAKTHEHDMGILLHELEAQKEKCRKLRAKLAMLKDENRRLLIRMPRAT